MKRSEAHKRLLRLNREHAADRDGGYALVEAIRRAEGELSPGDRAVLAEALGDLVRGEHPQLWGVALEALVQAADRDQVVPLGPEIASPTRSDDWKDNVVLGLLRLGEGRLHGPIVAHVRSSLENERKLTIPILAALCRIDRETCLELAVEFFEDAHAKGRKIDGFIPAFARNFIAVDEALLGELVHRLRARRVEAGESLAASFDAYVSKPWMLEELGSERVERLRSGLRAERTRGRAGS
jgi:hypothetical protein